MAAWLLEEAARRLLSGTHDARELQEMLAPVNMMLHDQTLPPCTCWKWRGSPESRFWYCRRHNLGAARVGTPATAAISSPFLTMERGGDKERCTT